MGIAGVPGSGKSTTAKAVGSRINALRPRLDKHHVAVVVGMDGQSQYFLATSFLTHVISACEWQFSAMLNHP